MVKSGNWKCCLPLRSLSNTRSESTESRKFEQAFLPARLQHSEAHSGGDSGNVPVPRCLETTGNVLPLKAGDLKRFN